MNFFARGFVCVFSIKVKLSSVEILPATISKLVKIKNRMMSIKNDLKGLRSSGGRTRRKKVFAQNIYDRFNEASSACRKFQELLSDGFSGWRFNKNEERSLLSKLHASLCSMEIQPIVICFISFQSPRTNKSENLRPSFVCAYQTNGNRYFVVFHPFFSYDNDCVST